MHVRLGTALAMAAALMTGCVPYNDRVAVHVRDRSRVTVATDSRGGTVPITRHADDVLSAECPWCTPPSSHELVDEHGTVELVGPPDDTLARDDDTLHMRFDYDAPEPCRHHHSRPCSHTAFSIDLVTPRANVTDIRFAHRATTRDGDFGGAKLAIALGVIVAAVGGAGLAYYDVEDHAHGWSWGTSLLGNLAGLALGGYWFGLGYATITAEDSDTLVEP